MYGMIFEDQTNLQRYASMKDNGTSLSMDMLSETVLTQLWADDLASDQQIAQVFNCTPYEVHQLREKYGVNHKSCIKKYFESFGTCLGTLGASIMAL